MLRCGDCNAPMVRRTGVVRGRERIFFGCTRYPDCKGTCSANQFSGLPSGIPADAETRRLRVYAHQQFDKLWRSKRMTRAEAYSWMQSELGLAEDDAHISRLDAQQCRRLMDAVRALRKSDASESASPQSSDASRESR